VVVSPFRCTTFNFKYLKGNITLHILAKETQYFPLGDLEIVTDLISPTNERCT
jgi:hypothetical protein